MMMYDIDGCSMSHSTTVEMAFQRMFMFKPQLDELYIYHSNTQMDKNSVISRMCISENVTYAQIVGKKHRWKIRKCQTQFFHFFFYTIITFSSITAFAPISLKANKMILHYVNWFMLVWWIRNPFQHHHPVMLSPLWFYIITMELQSYRITSMETGIILSILIWLFQALDLIKNTRLLYV